MNIIMLTNELLLGEVCAEFLVSDAGQVVDAKVCALSAAEKTIARAKPDLIFIDMAAIRSGGQFIVPALQAKYKRSKIVLIFAGDVRPGWSNARRVRI